VKPLLLLDAAPFCFGPASTLQVVLDELLDDDLELVLLSSGSTAQFMTGYTSRCTQVACDTEDRAQLAEHSDLFRRCDLFVSNTNPISAQYAIELGVPVLFIDTLFWMWDEIEASIARSAIYVAQTFPGINENRRRIGRDIVDFRVVGPLIRTPRPRSASNVCLISYGGMLSKLTVPGVTNHYPWVMTRLLLEAFEQAPPFERYLFRGAQDVMDALAREFRDSRVEFAFAPSSRHIEEVAAAHNMLLSPGLTGAYEALHAGVPTWLLLPQNYSQQLQAEVFLDDEQPRFEGRHWRDVYPSLDLPRYMPEAEAVARVNDAILRFEDDRAAQQRYVADLVAALPLNGRRPAPDVAPGSACPPAEVAAMIRQTVHAR
jgi:hypothetical protein